MNEIFEAFINKEEKSGNYHTQPKIKILLFNKLERAVKTYAQVLAIQKFETRSQEFKGLNQFLLFQECQQQLRFMKQFEEKYQNTNRKNEFEEAKNEYKTIQCLLQQMLSKENQLFIQQLSNENQNFNIQPNQIHLEVLNKYHLQSYIDFDSLLINDSQRKDLQQKMIEYSQRLSQYLYFYFIKEQDPNLKLLLNFILIKNTQNNLKMFEILNNYIKSFIQQEKQTIIYYLRFIMSIFDELSDFFNIIIQVIDDKVQLDSILELNQKQFDIIQLILDNSRSQQINNYIVISQASSNILRQIMWIYNTDCSQQFLISQQQQLTNIFSKEVDEIIIQDLKEILDYFQSVKLKLFIEKIIEYNKKMEKEIKLEYLQFNIFLPQDQETLYKLIYQQYQEPPMQIQQSIAQLSFSTDSQAKKIIFSFLNILSFAAYLDQKKMDSNDYIELQKLISDEIEYMGSKNDPSLLVTRLRIRQALVYFLQLQKLEQNSFKEIWRLSVQFRLYLEDKQISIINPQKNSDFPSLNQILSIYRYPQNESLKFKTLKNEIIRDLFKGNNDFLHNDFYQMMNLIEQYNSQNQQNFLENVKQYYKKDFKEHLKKLEGNGSEKVKQAINCILQNLKG